MKKFLSIFVLLVLISGPVHAGPSGAYIIPGCVNLLSREDNSPKAGYCAGVLNTIMTFSADSGIICLPQGISTPELVPPILLWKSQPDALERDFIGLAIIAITLEWPCVVEETDPDQF